MVPFSDAPAYTPKYSCRCLPVPPHETPPDSSPLPPSLLQELQLPSDDKSPVCRSVPVHTPVPGDRSRLNTACLLHIPPLRQTECERPFLFSNPVFLLSVMLLCILFLQSAFESVLFLICTHIDPWIPLSVHAHLDVPFLCAKRLFPWQTLPFVFGFIVTHAPDNVKKNSDLLSTDRCQGYMFV